MAVQTQEDEEPFDYAFLMMLDWVNKVVASAPLKQIVKPSIVQGKGLFFYFFVVLA